MKVSLFYFIFLVTVIISSLLPSVLSLQQTSNSQQRSRQRNQNRNRNLANDGRSSSSSAFPLAYVMASGVEDVVGGYTRAFSCDGRDYGYYSDIANNCQIYHICVPPRSQYTFFCNNGTVFDQKALTCVREEDSIPCGQQERYYALNANFGVQDPARLVYLD